MKYLIILPFLAACATLKPAPVVCAVPLAPPLELAQPFTPEVKPVFTSPNDPDAVVALSKQQAINLKTWAQDLWAWGDVCHAYYQSQ